MYPQIDGGQWDPWKLRRHTRSAYETTTEAITGQSNAKGKRNQIGDERTDTVLPPMDMNSLLKTLRVDVPRFDCSNVNNWIYRINKIFSLHQIDPGMRLAVVAFHLDGEPSMWYQ